MRDLERHCLHPAKRAKYERLLRDLGIDVERFSHLVQHPRLILAEQPGNWFCGGDLMRYRLLRRLIETAQFHKSSGVLSLASDAFTCRGIKKLFMVLDLHPRLQPVPLLGASFIRRHRNRVYDALPLAGSAGQRIATILDLCDRMLASAAVSSDAFANEVIAIFKAGLPPGVRPLLPPREDRKSLRELGVELSELDLDAARQPLAMARRELRPDDCWAHYWNRVNRAFLGTEVGDLGPLFNRFLLTVDDPIRMSHQLLRLTHHPVDEPIAVASLITDDDKYRMVYFDPEDDSFHTSGSGGQGQPISWAQVHSLAENDRTGGPSGTLEYLLMAASGIYLVADPDDGHNPFERQARAIHQQTIGLPFPYLSFSTTEGQPPTDYLSIYHPDFDSMCQRALEPFFA